MDPQHALKRIAAILKHQRGITGDTAIRLGMSFKTPAEFWMNLQMIYDLRNAAKALPARVRKSIAENRSLLEDAQDRRLKGGIVPIAREKYWKEIGRNERLFT